MDADVTGGALPDDVSALVASAASGPAPSGDSEDASRETGELLLMLGHEMRNPLNAIATAVEVLNRAAAASPEAQSARRIIGRQTRSLAQLLDELGEMGRAMADEIPLLRQPLDLGALTQRCVACAGSGLAAKMQTLEVALAPSWVQADAHYIGKAIDRLFDHMVRETPPGGRINVRMTTRTGPAGHEALIELRGDRSDGPLSVGTPAARSPRPGIALALARSLIEKHGGRLEETIRAEAGRPSRCVVLRLPACPAPEAEPPCAPGAPARIGVIDDNADALFVVCALLELGGHAVSTAGDGPDGVAMLLRDAPDVAIVDIGLPGFDGYEVARRSRAGGFQGRLIALSGLGPDGNSDRERSAGFELHLVKPVSTERLLRLLAE